MVTSVPPLLRFFLLPLPHLPQTMLDSCNICHIFYIFFSFFPFFWYQYLRAKYVNQSLWDTHNQSRQHGWYAILISGKHSENGSRQILWPSVEWDPPSAGVKIGGILWALTLFLFAVSCYDFYLCVTQGQGRHLGELRIKTWLFRPRSLYLKPWPMKWNRFKMCTGSKAIPTIVKINISNGAGRS